VLSPPALAGVSNPDDPYFTARDQWGLTGSPSSINVPAAWCVGTGRGVLVADIDSGADFAHPDLAGKLVAGAAFLNGSGQPSGTGVAAVTDDNGHGTMTTGLIVANTNNHVGIAAVAPDAKALIMKVLDAQGNGNDTDVAAAVQWAVDHGAKVINLSIGADVPLTGDMSNMTSAVDYAYRHGAIVALAAGNNSLPLTDYQFSQIAEEALVVGALGPTGSVAYYSTSGVGVNVYAPGGDDTYGTNAKGLILSTHTKEGYAVAEGTSFAAPHAAGVLALLVGRGMTGPQARQRVLDTVDNSSGEPKLDAARALGASGGCPTANNTGTGTAPVPLPRRVGTNPSGTNTTTRTASPATTAHATPKASVSVSSPDTASPSAAPVLAAPAPRHPSSRSRSWTLIAGAAAAAAIASGFALLTFTRR
jgi:subtilisin family serine protease